MQFTKQAFPTLLDSICRCYAKDSQTRLPNSAAFPDSIYRPDQTIDFDKLDQFGTASDDIYIQSVAKRVMAIHQIDSFRNQQQDVSLKDTWKLVADSILILPSGDIISSIGSQGFLSIPLYKYDAVKSDFDFIRLHIWHDSLNDYVNANGSDQFSIHTHSFFAQSWIICGNVVNDTFKVTPVSTPTDWALFTVEYNKTLNEINQHASVAVNTGQAVDLHHQGHEEHRTGEQYSVAAGDYHRSVSLGQQGLSATFFSFTAKEGLVKQSYVVGPSAIEQSAINRKMQIDPTRLIQDIDAIVSTYER